jgi:hypothetical protein
MTNFTSLPNMLKATAQQGQTYFDIALQTFGSIEGVFMLTSGNISNEPEPGTSLMADGVVINRYVANYYLNNNIIPATGLAKTISNEGIGYWLIENDFIVQ